MYWIIHCGRKLRTLSNNYFCSYDKGFLETAAGQQDVDAHVFRRYEQCSNYVVPWVNRQLNLCEADIVELGCGTGSSTAAFAGHVAKVHAYEIDERSIIAAKSRLEIMEISNVTFYQVAPESILNEIKQNHSEGIDVFLLYAVLEHLTIQERLELLKTSWDLLSEGGLLVVKSPNRLAYFDHHTSQLPFFHMLPDELAKHYYDKSPRFAFVQSMNSILESLAEDFSIARYRWGLGISYHEFEIAIGQDYAKMIVCDGYEDEILQNDCLRWL